MEVQLFLYGTPKGESIWGKDKSDYSYFSNHYNSNKDKLKFLIEVRNINGKQYTYYNYLVGGEFRDVDGRTGAFFGISLRFDAYCHDYLTVYRILDWTYQNFIVGNLINRIGNKYEYAISSLKNADASIQNIEKQIVALLNLTLQNATFTTAIDVVKAQPVNSYNIPEATDEEIFIGIEKSGKANLSPFYPRKEDNSAAQQYAEQISKLQSQISQLNTSTKGLNKTITDLNQLNDVLHKENEDLKSKIILLQSEANKSKQFQNIAALIESIKRPINELADFLKKDKPKDPIGGRPGTKKIPTKKLLDSAYKSVTLILLLAIFCLLTFCSGNGAPKTNELDEPQDQQTEEVTASVSIDDNSLQDVNNGADGADEILSLYSNGRIDITPSPIDEKITKGGNYTVSFLLENHTDTGGELICDDLIFKEKNGKYSFSAPTENKTLTFIYKLNGIEVKSRQIEVK